ncbi:MAG: hypothetical protein K2O56_11310 [Muribaculaceae bacterium]|nr:hypothetical protein [Muribaculaceae bacterium]
MTRTLIILIFSFLATAGTNAAALLPDSLAVQAPDSVAALPTDSVTVSQPDSVTKPAHRTPRKSTPVDIDDDKPREILHFYDKHGNALAEPVRFLAVLDTVTKPKSKPVYPLFNGWTLGVNFGDAIFMAAGQKHGSFDIWADVSLHNWFFPVVEAGVGFADNKPEENNYSYTTRPSFYAKVGMNYNFMYKSDPAYQVFAGFRVGFSSFKYDVDNVTITDGYWDQTQSFSMKGLKASAVYGEILAGIKVKIVGNFSLGWNARWHMKFKVSSKSSSEPWFIPGYGASSPFSFSLSAIWRFGQKRIDPDDPGISSNTL